jgi:hypothetical protein
MAPGESRNQSHDASFLHEGGRHAEQRTNAYPKRRHAAGPTPTPGIPDRVQEKPPLTPVQDPGDSKNPQDPTLDPALLPIGDPAGAA